jgi:POT family proton-dependent oligopeptide transporter
MIPVSMSFVIESSPSTTLPHVVSFMIAFIHMEIYAEATEPARPDTHIAGHPPGVAILAVTEVWERFSYYGMRALLIFYMIKHLHFSQAHASTIYGAYTAAVWMTPLFGGIIADRLIGQHRAVLFGGGLMAAGHFMMAFESLFFPALAAIAIGNGLFKPNVSTQVGDLYARDDPRKDRGYSVFYVGINFGAFLAPLGCGTVGELFGWHWGFGLAGVGMLAALGTYVYGRRWLPPDRRCRPSNQIAPVRSTPINDARRIATLTVISLGAALFWMIFEQQGNTIALWADTYTDRVIRLGDHAMMIPASWFQCLNGLFIVTLTPIVLAIWRHQASRGREPETIVKMGIGAAIGGLSYVLMAVAAIHEGASGPVSWLWLCGYFSVLTFGELYLSPTCLSLFNELSPSRLASTMLGVWYMSLFLGSYLAGFSGTFWGHTSKPAYFAAMAACGFLSSAALFAVRRSLRLPARSRSP